MPGLNQPLLINVLGHAAGALIFAIFLVLLYSGRGWSGVRDRHLAGLAAGLSLVWNIGSLLVLAWPGLPPQGSAAVVAISFSVLSLLPAVLLHLSIGNLWPSLTGIGYVLSAAAVVMHFQEIRGGGAALHQRALLLITIGFVLLTVAAVVRAILAKDPGRRPNGIRIAASMCLVLFAMSFVHFGAGHASQVWASELLLHHAGIPLALFVLLQDYRFVLLDAFVRFLANALLAALLTGLVIAAAFRLVLVERVTLEPLNLAFLLIAVCLFLVLFAWLRNRTQTWLTHAVFRQGSVTDLPSRLRNAPVFSEESQYLEWAAGVIRTAVKTADYQLVNQSEAGHGAELHLPVTTNLYSKAPDWAEVAVPIRLGPGEVKLILLGRRQGGRRYLGEDLDALAGAAAEVADHVESLRRQEMNRLVAQAELRALQSQINPHFLFNALNTLYGTIPRQAAGARRIVLNLAEIFRYFLQSDKTFVPLSEEMQIVRAYLEVEQLRLGDRLHVEIRMEDAALDALIPVLSIQPLVENAVKHGVAQRAEPGFIRIRSELHGEELRIVVENSGSGSRMESAGAGVGLENVRRRLEICYGSEAALRLDVRPDITTAKLSLPRTRVTARI
jgi:two-component system, LytTR family, sensor kinase